LSSCFKDYDSRPRNPLKNTTWRKIDSTLTYVSFADFIQHNYVFSGDCYVHDGDEYEIDSNKIYRYEFGNGEFEIREDTLIIITSAPNPEIYFRTKFSPDTIVICAY
jgi:hypothetical protein